MKINLKSSWFLICRLPEGSQQFCNPLVFLENMKKIDNILIGQTISFFIKEKKLKKGEVAKTLDMTGSNLTHLLQGVHSLSVSKLLHLCEIFEISPQKFFNKLDKEKLHVIY